MGATGVVVSFATDVADKDGFAECAKNVALQTAAMDVKYLDKESVPASVLAEEEAILIKQMKEDPKMANKPDNILANIVKGRLGKFYETNCLTEQAYVKDDSLTIAKYVDATAKEFGGKIALTGFWCFERGEGLEKREDDFAEEIARLTGKAE
jgi:elongation factor Ts